MAIEKTFPWNLNNLQKRQMLMCMWFGLGEEVEEGLGSGRHHRHPLS